MSLQNTILYPDPTAHSRALAETRYQTSLDNLRLCLLAFGLPEIFATVQAAAQYHPGFRKDNITPSFSHQIEIIEEIYDERHWLQAAGLNVGELINLAAYHDVLEDVRTAESSVEALQLAKQKAKEEITALCSERVAHQCYLLDKTPDGGALDIKTYFLNVAGEDATLVIKLFDRRHNIRTIQGLEATRQAEYIVESMALLRIAMAVSREREQNAESEADRAFAAIVKSKCRQIESLLKGRVDYVAEYGTGKEVAAHLAYNKLGLIELHCVAVSSTRLLAIDILAAAERPMDGGAKPEVLNCSPI